MTGEQLGVAVRMLLHHKTALAGTPTAGLGTLLAHFAGNMVKLRKGLSFGMAKYLLWGEDEFDCYGGVDDKKVDSMHSLIISHSP